MRRFGIFPPRQPLVSKGRSIKAQVGKTVPNASKITRHRGSLPVTALLWGTRDVALPQLQLNGTRSSSLHHLLGLLPEKGPR